MKKIIGILLAGALVTSAFAADVNAKVNLLGSLFNFSADGNKVGALAIAEGGQGWNPSFEMSVNGDVAGASMKFYDAGATKEVSNVNYSIWFKPFDMLKVTVGNFSTNLNSETIDYTTDTKIDSNGIALSLNVSGFFADAFFASGWSEANFGWDRTNKATYWFSTKEGDEKAKIGELYLRAGYSADFGTISGYYNFVSESSQDFGLGYKNTFGSVEMFVNALGFLEKDGKFDKIRAEVFAKTNVDALGLAAFVPVEVSLKDENKNKPVSLGAVAKVTYSLGSVTPYLYLKGANFLASEFSMTIKPGITGNVGSMSWDLAVDITAQKNIVIDVPVAFTVAW